MSTLTKDQKKTFRATYTTKDGKLATIVAKVRHDDECGNGHNTFSITGDVSIDGRWDSEGCIHEEIAKHFPALAPFIKWHLTSTDGPLHYPANALFHASDKDHWGHRAGEPSRFEHGLRFGDSPVTHTVKASFWKFLQERQGTGEFIVVGIAHGGSKEEAERYGTHYTFNGYGDKWHECPFRSKVQADEFAEGMNRCRVEFVKLPVEFSNGKPRDLDAARSCAVWPEATDDELCAPDLAQRLADRLPGLMAEFRLAVESLGFVY